MDVVTHTHPQETSLPVLQKEEVESVEWFDMDYVQSVLEPRDARFCVPTDGFLIAKKWCEEHL